MVNASSVLCELVICEMSKRQNASSNLSSARIVYLSTSNFNLKPLWSLRWILKGQNVKLGNVEHFRKVLHAHPSRRGPTRFMRRAGKFNCLRNYIREMHSQLKCNTSWTRYLKTLSLKLHTTIPSLMHRILWIGNWRATELNIFHVKGSIVFEWFEE